jgi:hypothetical protein
MSILGNFEMNWDKAILGGGKLGKTFLDFCSFFDQFCKEGSEKGWNQLKCEKSGIIKMNNL